MRAEGLDLGGLTSQALKQRFVVGRRRLGYVSRLSSGELRPLVDYLEGLGLLCAGEDLEPTAVDRLVEEFCRYLFEERGLVEGSVRLYARIARRFLEERPEPLADGLAHLCSQEINAFVLREAPSGQTADG